MITEKTELSFIQIEIKKVGAMVTSCKNGNCDLKYSGHGDINKKVVKYWNRLPQEVVESPSSEIFTTLLNMALSNLI